MEFKRFIKISITLKDGTVRTNVTKDFGIATGSLHLEEMLCDTSLQFNQICASKFEANCFNLSDDITGCKINVACIYNKGEEDEREVPLFSGKIDSAVLDDFNVSREIIAYDMIYFLRDLNVAPWWEEFWKDDTPTVTLKELRESLCDYCDLEYDDVTLPNDSLVITKYAQFTAVTFDRIMTMICEANGCFGHIGRDGKFKWIRLETSNPTALGAYEKKATQFEDFTTADITGVNIYADTNDLIYPNDPSEEEAITGIVNRYSIAANIFFLGLGDDIATPYNNLYNAIKDIKYTPCKVKMLVSDLSVNVGDYVSTDHGNHYVLSQEFSGSILVEQELNCPAKAETLDQTAPVTNETIVMNQKFSSVTKTAEEFATQVAVTEATTAVSSMTTQITDSMTQIIQRAEDIEFKVNNNTEIIDTYGTQLTELTTKVKIEAEGVKISQGDDNTYTKFTDSGMEMYTKESENPVAWANSSGFSAIELMIGATDETKWHIYLSNDGNTLTFLRR